MRSVIMFACDELHFATGAQAMIHKPLCMAYGNADDFKAVIKQLNLCEDSILDVYMEHVQEGVTRDKIQSLMSNETSTEIARAKANGAGWNIGSWSKRNLLNCMLKIMSKTDNSQTAFGQGQTTGYVNDSSKNYGHLATGTLTGW